MRFVATPTALLLVTLLLDFVPASAMDKRVPDPQMLLALQTKAAQAQPREQCFLYAELVHSMAEVAGQQLSTGDNAHASATLEGIQAYAAKIHVDMAENSKKLKKAEMLMRDTAFRVKELLEAAPLADRPTLQSTLKQLNNIQEQLLMYVFKQ